MLDHKCVSSNLLCEQSQGRFTRLCNQQINYLRNCIKFNKFVITLSLAFAVFISMSTAHAVYQETLPSGVLIASKNLKYELNLLEQHNILSKHYAEHFDEIVLAKQPANKTEKCIVKSDLLDGQIDNTTLLFWEGSCKDGAADGFGRLYVVHGGRKTFELLANFQSESPDFSTVYFYKNTKVDTQTKFFYGKSNRFSSSGITITRTNLDKDLLVSMEAIDKQKLVTYAKETSQNSNYILNIMDLGNYSHLIHDLKNTAYRSLAMSYKLVESSNGTNVGYSLLGLKTGELQGEYHEPSGRSMNSDIPEDVIIHIQEINEEIEVAIEDSIKNVIEALPVVDAYLNVICDQKYDNPVCRKMQCKLMCDTKQTITPDNEEVKSLLLRLVDHHNNRPTEKFLQTVMHK